MIKKTLGVLAMVLVATAILLPNTACRRNQDTNWQMTGVPEIDSAVGLEVSL